MKATAVGIISLVLIFGNANSVYGQADVILMNLNVPLTNSCTGGQPLPDGHLVYFKSDANNNGPDPADSTVATFSINGVEMEIGPGRFATDPIRLNPAFPQPWRHYVQSDVCDFGIRWFSDVFTILPGINEYLLNAWNCVSCELTEIDMFMPMCEWEHIFTDECNGGDPLPDGTPVYIYWDENGNGPDDADTLIPTNSDSISVNFNTVWINGEMNGLPGTFCIDPAVFQVRTTIVPLRLYLYLPVCDSSIQWTSDVIVLHPDSTFSGFVWHCDSCETLPVTRERSLLASEIVLHPNFPNPFNPATEISFDLPRATNVSLRVFDLLGREVVVLVNGEVSAGAHRVEFDGRELASGVYFYRLDAGEFSQTRKMVLMK